VSLLSLRIKDIEGEIKRADDEARKRIAVISERFYVRPRMQVDLPPVG